MRITAVVCYTLGCLLFISAMRVIADTPTDSPVFHFGSCIPAVFFIAIGFIFWKKGKTI